MLHVLAYATNPNLRATASEASLVHDVLYSGTRPEPRTAKAHAAVTRGPSPRPRNSTAVSTPASAATSERRAQKHTLTACPFSTTPTIGLHSGISLACHPENWWSSSSMSSMSTVPEGGAIAAGNTNEGPASTRPESSDKYRSTCTGAIRKSDTGGSSRASSSSSSATSFATSARTAHAQLAVPRISENTGPGLGSNSRVPAIRPAPSSRYSVSSCSRGVLTAESGRRRPVAPCASPTHLQDSPRLVQISVDDRPLGVQIDTEPLRSRNHRIRDGSVTRGLIHSG